MKKFRQALSLSGLVTPVILVVLISATAFAWLARHSAEQQDQNAVAAQSQTIEARLKAATREAAIFAEDNAWWDAAVENAYLTEDLDWAESIWGELIGAERRLFSVMVLRYDQSVLYKKIGEGVASVDAFLDSGFGRVLQAMPAPSATSPSTVSGAFAVDGTIFLYGASIIVEFEREPPVRPELLPQKPYVVLVSELSAERLDMISREVGIEGAVFSQAIPAGPHVPLADSLGRTVSYVSWTPAAPGTKTVETLIVPLVAFLAVVIVLTYIFLRRASDVIVKLRAADHAKSQFLASMSHEIRTPLNTVLGFSELLALELYGKVEGEKNKEYVRMIKESGNSLLTMIDDILEVSKIDADKYATERNPIDAKTVVDQSLLMVENLEGEKELAFSVKLEPGQLYSDDRIVRQVLLNIISNAVKFTPAGGHIEITGEQQSDSYDITVSDTGPGMSKEQLKTAKSLFGQLGDQYTRTHAGTGLGLPLVRRFMKLVGAHFDIHSVPGAGTSVRLSFPASA